MKNLFSLCFFLGCLHIVNATNYYVATNGEDSNSGIRMNQAWATIQKAADIMVGGDTCFVAEGTYQQDIKINRSGIKSGALTFKAINKWGAKITSENYIFNIGESVEKVGFITIDGFELVAPGTYGVGVHSKKGAHHITVKNCWAHNCGESGISLQDGDYLTIENNVCNNNSALMKFCGSGISIYGTYLYDSEPGFHNIIRNNISYNNMNDAKLTLNTDGNGIIVDDLRNSQKGNHFGNMDINYSGNETLVENNLCYGNGGAGIQLFLSNNITVRNNTCYNNQLRRSNDEWRGNISVSCCANVKFINNISVVNSSLRADKGDSDWPQFSKNTAYGAFGANGNMYAANYSYYNNISFDLNNPTSDAIVSDGITIEFVDANGNKSATDPLFLNPGILDSSDFHLKPGSPAINSGTLKFGASKYDLDNKARTSKKINIGAYF